MRNSQKKSDYSAPREMYIEVGFIENGERSKLLFMTLPQEEMNTSALIETAIKNAPAQG